MLEGSYPGGLLSDGKHAVHVTEDMYFFVDMANPSGYLLRNHLIPFLHWCHTASCIIEYHQQCFAFLNG